ncbi:efflux RND transporter permease subunit [Roseibacillus ishigakijimensis]|uniref:Efflux RND transporter permease subunit n=1 Tax=Roseibacillus ishigakijimensis TaxID=454146 RepID=A0A934RVJ5_9BACT|nr:efflux RND transporter permease subunit [Roseibacillus ishigakijimensis]MBK1834945.1 efflux RND transporter permease subunit [Roseibacillus ishigakijimensis]
MSEGEDNGKGLIAWWARNSIAANLLMMILLGGGIFTALKIQKEVFPDFAVDIVEVQVGYPGAAPSEVEQGILLPIEETVRGVEGIKEMNSQAQEGNGTVSIELIAGVDRMRAFQDIDQAVSRIRTFPDDIEQPEVRLQARTREVMNVVLYGQADDMSLRVLAERLRDRLLSEEGITQVELHRVPEYVTHVEISRAKLREYGLTLSEVAGIIRASSEDTAAGSVETRAGEILLRMKERKQFADEFSGIEILAAGSGATVTLGDIATIRDGFEEGEFPSQFNQGPSIQVNIFRVGDQSPLDISATVDRVMKEFEASLPEGISWRIDSNSAEDFRDRMMLLLENGGLAILIVMGILTLFLEIRLAFWVMMGMTASFIGGIMLLPLVGISISMVSMFAFLIVLGIVVDDAIVVGENIYETRQQVHDPLRAATLGASDISRPVVFSILTTVIAFVPLMFIPGTLGNFWKPLPWVVILVLLVSLVEALFILPSHLAHLPRKSERRGLSLQIHKLQQLFLRGFDWFIQNVYRRILDGALRYRYVTIVGSVVMFLVVGKYATSAHMGMILMPEVSADEIEAGIRLPVGVTPDQAARVANEVTAATRKMFDEHGLDEVSDGIKTNVRRGSFVDVEIVMKPPDERDMTAKEVIRLWRDEIEDIAGVSQITFQAESGPGGPRPDVSVSLSHTDTDVLEKASRDLLAKLAEFTIAKDVNDDFDRGKSQLDFELLPEGRALGLTAAGVGQQVRDAFYGALALRYLRGTNEVEVRVKLPKNEREDIHHLEDLVIQTPAGTEVPLMEVVKVKSGEAFTRINRRDGRRVVNVSMDIEPKRAITQMITALNIDVLPQLRADYPGITWTFEGSEADMRESTAALWSGFGVAIVIIYALLAVAFSSYIQPLIVLSAIPFGLVGAIAGHILLGFDLSLISIMGVIALSGVVVNDSIIMIDYANKKREVMPVFAAIREAGLRRFRPILLTTMTTFGGLTPIILEKSLQAQYLIPMAISLGFGIIFATAIILVLVPCLYLTVEEWKIRMGK